MSENKCVSGLFVRARECGCEAKSKHKHLNAGFVETARILG